MNETDSQLEIVENYRAIEKQIASEKGAFALFALLQRDDEPDKWDLLFAAPWAQEDQLDAVRYITNQIKAALGQDALLELSRVILVDLDDPQARKYVSSLDEQHGFLIFENSYLFGQHVRKAFIFTLDRQMLLNGPISSHSIHKKIV